jgi:hypothetical protein
MCHDDECARTSANHPCGIRNWNSEKYGNPRALPLFNGYITCRTCHLHTRREQGDYKMVRIVTVEGAKVDWSGLCRDCHADR